MNKYHAKKTVLNGIKFDSRKEALRWAELSLLERRGEISGLERQVRFELVAKEKGPAGQTLRKVVYVADFSYTDKKGIRHVEDAKGVRTAVYKLKKRLMWHLKKIDIEEV